MAEYRAPTLDPETGRIYEHQLPERLAETSLTEAARSQFEATVKVPTSAPKFAGTAYGDSWTYANYSAIPYPEQLVGLMGLSGMDNRGVSGSRIQNVALYAQAVTGKPWVPGTKGMVTVGALLNNQAEPDDVNNRNTALESTRALVARLSAATIRQQDDASIFTYNGTFNSFTHEAADGGTARYANPTLTDGQIYTNTVTLTVPAGINYVQFIGLAPQTARGATVILFDSSNVEITRLATDGMSRVTPGGIGTGARAPLVLRIPGTTGGTFTLKFTTPTGYAGQVWAFIDCLITLAENPPMVVLLKPVHVLHASYQKPELETYLRSIPDLMATEFKNVVVADPNEGFNTATMLGEDLLHPNSEGQAHVTKLVRNAVNATILRKAAILAMPGLV